jgi:pyridoxamine 5'-phosphate oxidase
MNSKNLRDIRLNYSQKALGEEEAESGPLDLFSRWMEEAIQSEIKEPTAMTLATVDWQGLPDARIVLLKGISESKFQFFTNYNSKKGKDLEKTPEACLVFFWAELERQVRIRGKVTKLTKNESEEYFQSRPIESQIGAYTSNQSEKIPNREFLESKYQEMRNKFLGKEKLPLPEYWGGYELSPRELEFWQGRPSRLHDRILFSKKPDTTSGDWVVSRLSP